MFQLYVHKDKGLNRSMIDRCKAANFDAIALTVDTIVGGNRERCLRSVRSPKRLRACKPEDPTKQGSQRFRG